MCLFPFGKQFSSPALCSEAVGEEGRGPQLPSQGKAGEGAASRAPHTVGATLP